MKILVEKVENLPDLEEVSCKNENLRKLLQIRASFPPFPPYSYKINI